LLSVLLVMLLLLAVWVSALVLMEVDFSRWRRLPRGLDFSLVSFALSFKLPLLLLSFWGFDLVGSSSSFLRRDRRVVAEARRGRALESMDDSDSSSLPGHPFSGGSADMIFFLLKTPK
jgi:hypothetical protein